MPMQMWKDKVSEIVDNKNIIQRLKDGWAFKPSTNTFKSVKGKREKVSVTEVNVINPTTDLDSPEDLNNKE
jgi:uncharacterized FAD-dependent dehydrogenase